MRPCLLPLLFLLLAAGAPGQASRLEVVDDAYRIERVDVMESFPVQFALRLTRDLPSSGWTIEVDGVEREGRRIVARVHEIPPDGPAATVMTPTSVRLALGSLPTGTYVLEVEARRGEEPAVPVAAIVLTATGPAGGPAGDLARSESPYRVVGVVLAKSMPPAFWLVLSRDLPTPGWTFEVEVDRDGRRIAAEVTEVRPDGIVAQVISPTEVRIELGRLPAWTYVLVVDARRGDEVATAAYLLRAQE